MSVIPSPMPAPATAGPGTRLVVYTVLIGAKEALNNPLSALPAGAGSDLVLDYVCLTDNPELRSPVWRCVPIDESHLAPEKASRRAKAMPDAYFPDADYSLYIDNTVTFKRLPQSADLQTRQVDGEGRAFVFRAFKHSRHTHLHQEAGAIAMLGYDDVATVCRQLDAYAQQGPLAEITPLTTGTVLLRSHHAPALRHFGRLWWESILAYSKRDQLSLDMARRRAGIEIDYFPGITRDNEFLHWQGSLSPERLRASFDARRYAWQHRDEPEAAANPRRHALAHGRGGEPQYQCRTELLEYLCWQHRASLGAQVSPRRGLAGALEGLLRPWRRDGQRVLVVRVTDVPDALGFSAAELDAASHALVQFFGPGSRTDVLDLGFADLASSGRVFALPQGGAYPVLIALGVPAAKLQAATQKLARLQPRNAGLFTAVLAGSASLDEARAAEALMADVTGTPTRSALGPAQHDSLADPVPNALLGLAWGASST